VPGPSQLVIISVTGGFGTVNIPIPTALQTLDSTVPGSTQQGISSVDQLIRSIFRAGVFTDGQGKWYSAYQIATITAQ
jgi:hypothetical protein